MIRNLKVLLVAAMALTALASVAASAHAASDVFHCSVSPCIGTLKPDGTAKTAHHVFIVENAAATESVSFTCESLGGEGEATTEEFTEQLINNLGYTNCNANGSTGVTVDMNGCTYTFFAAGGTSDGAKVKITCPAGKKIEITYNGCVMSIAGGFEATGIGYHNEGSAPNREVTVTTKVTIPSTTISASGTKAQCLINPAQALTGTYTTGNTLLTGETKAGAIMADAWYL